MLVLYEPPLPGIAPPLPATVPERMEELIARGEPEAALELMMREVVRMPEHELERYRHLPAWKARVAIVPTVPRELAVDRTYRFDAERFKDLRVPTALLLGGDSPQHARRTVELVDSALPNSQIVVLPGQQHIAMDMDPDLFVRRVVRFLWE